MNEVNAVTKDEVAMIHTALNNKFGQLYADVWKIGVNMALRIGDLLDLKYTDLNLIDRTLILKESKTNKDKQIRLNDTVLGIINRRRAEFPNDVWLFQVHSNRASDKPVSRVSVSRVFKAVGDMFNLNVNTHSMRKSRGKALYTAGMPIEKICKVLNHSSPKTTMAYIGITKDDVQQTYDDFQL